jgi:hypothetical protein
MSILGQLTLIFTAEERDGVKRINLAQYMAQWQTLETTTMKLA